MKIGLQPWRGDGLNNRNIEHTQQATRPEGLLAISYSVATEHNKALIGGPQWLKPLPRMGGPIMEVASILDMARPEYPKSRRKLTLHQLRQAQ